MKWGEVLEDDTIQKKERDTRVIVSLIGCPPSWEHEQQIFISANSLTVLWERKFGDGQALSRVPEGDPYPLRYGFTFLLFQRCWGTTPKIWQLTFGSASQSHVHYSLILPISL